MGALYRTHGALVYRRVCRFYSSDQAEEITHEVWERVVRTIGSWRRDASVVTWLYQVTTRHCLNRIRDAHRRVELGQRFGEPSWSSAISPSNQEAWTDLRQLVQRVDPELFQVGLYYYRDGLSQAQIATLLGVSRRTIGHRLDELKRVASSTPEESSQ